MVTFVAGFVDPGVAGVLMPAIQAFNMRVRAIKDADARERLRTEIYSKLDLPKITVARVADHIDYVRKIAGPQSVGLGSDFDGSDFRPQGLSDVSMYPNLYAELIRRGWSDADLRLLTGENVLRVLGEAEKVSARLRATTPRVISARWVRCSCRCARSRPQSSLPPFSKGAATWPRIAKWKRRIYLQRCDA